MDLLQDKFKAFLAEFGRGRKMVLSTAADGRVSSRMMSVVRLDDTFCFQTDIELRKYDQLMKNKNVALCIDNIQIEGKCEEVGHPLKNSEFVAAFQACFKGSFDAYTSLNNERLFVVKPTFIERWVYIDAVPFVETFEIAEQRYTCVQYEGQ